MTVAEMHMHLCVCWPGPIKHVAVIRHAGGAEPANQSAAAAEPSAANQIMEPLGLIMSRSDTYSTTVFLLRERVGGWMAAGLRSKVRLQNACWLGHMAPEACMGVPQPSVQGDT